MSTASVFHAFVVLFLEGLAGNAGVGSTAEVSEAQPATDEAGVRIGLDLGLSAGAPFGTRCKPQGCGELGAVGIGLEIGYQLDRRWGIFLRPEGGTVLLSYFAGAYVMAEYTPRRWFSIASGLGAEGVASLAGRFLNTYGGIAIPLRLSWNFISTDSWTARQGNNAWRLSLAAITGVADNADIAGFVRGTLSFGFVWM